MLKFSILLYVALACAIEWSVVALPSSQSAGMPQLSSATSDGIQNSKLRVDPKLPTRVTGMQNFTSTLESATSESLKADIGKTSVGMLTRMLFYSLATDKSVAPSSKARKNVPKIAAFVANKCWTKLDRMEEADKIINDGVQNAAESTVRKLSSGKNADEDEILEPMFGPLETYINSNPKLVDEFQRFDVEQDKTKIQYYLVNQLFLTAISGHATLTPSFNLRVLIVKTLLNAARQAGRRQNAQKLYDDAILETVEKFDVNLYPNGMADILFEKFENKLGLARQGKEFNSQWWKLMRDALESA